SPWHTELALLLNADWRVSAVTDVRTTTPARNVAATPVASLPQPAMTAVSPTRASRLRSSGTGVRPMSDGITTTPTSSAVEFDSRHPGCGVNDCAVCCGPVPRKTDTDAVAAGRQCAAVRIAPGAITVPVHDPDGRRS